MVTTMIENNANSGFTCALALIVMLATNALACMRIHNPSELCPA